MDSVTAALGILTDSPSTETVPSPSLRCTSGRTCPGRALWIARFACVTRRAACHAALGRRVFGASSRVEAARCRRCPSRILTRRIGPASRHRRNPCDRVPKDMGPKALRRPFFEDPAFRRRRREPHRLPKGRLPSRRRNLVGLVHDHECPEPKRRGRRGIRLSSVSLPWPRHRRKSRGET